MLVPCPVTVIFFEMVKPALFVLVAPVSAGFDQLNVPVIFNVSPDVLATVYPFVNVAYGVPDEPLPVESLPVELFT